MFNSKDERLERFQIQTISRNPATPNPRRRIPKIRQFDFSSTFFFIFVPKLRTGRVVPSFALCT